MSFTSASRLPHFLAITGLAVFSASATGCLSHPLKPVELEKSQEDTNQIQLVVNKDVDILFVIDNSGSMGEEQGLLAANFGEFIAVLEAPEVKANYRLGVTTSDNGNVWCTGTTPEGGALVYSSCRDRIGQFTNQQGTVNVQAVACEQNCAFTNGDLGIDGTGDPWLENVEGTTNLPAGVTTTEAFQCLGPQGINGCGFESQMESMHKALLRFDTSGDPSQGFMRENALLAIVNVTDEVDCSYQSAWTAIFEQGGNRVFWWDPNSSFPTSAVCWNAGTKCTGDPSNYDCTAQDYDVNGNEIAADDPNVQANAVLHPLKRYVDKLQGIENAKKDINPGQEVIVALIAGVGDDQEPYYADSADTAFMSDFGIGAGCSAPVDGATACPGGDADCAGVGNNLCGTNGWCLENQTAIPPVRMAEFTDAFTSMNKFTICSNDYRPALQAIADAIVQQLKPACYAECVADSNPATPGIVEPNCQVQEQDTAGKRDLRECAKDPAGGGYLLDPATNDYQMPDVDTHVCFAMLTDPDGTVTANTLDDISVECTDEFYNLEFKIAREPGFPALGGTSVSATCALSDVPQVDCPGLE